MCACKNLAEAVLLTFASAQGLDFYSPVAWSCTCCHLPDHGLPALVLLLRTTILQADAYFTINRPLAGRRCWFNPWFRHCQLCIQTIFPFPRLQTLPPSLRSADRAS